MKPENRETDTTDEIEVTPEMIEAGVERLYCFPITEPDEDSMRAAVAEVYRVMVATYVKDECAI